MTQFLVRYVGLKASRNDNVAGTGLTWHGQGDVQPVPPAAWDKLKRHPDVWELVPSSTAAVEPVAGTLGAAKTAEVQSSETTAPPSDELEALRAEAKAKGVKVHHKINDPAKIRELIAAAEQAEA